MSHVRHSTTRFLAPSFLVLLIEANGGNREYEIPLREAYRSHPYELRELLDQIAAELDELQIGEC
jgi:hypothetical protein